MLNEARIEKLALFYYFAFLDEGKAQAATAKTLKNIQTLIAKKIDNKDFEVDLVRETETFVSRYGESLKTTALSFSSGNIQIPEGSNWGPWFEFRRIAERREFFAVLYNQVLGISENTIAEALRIPLGTVRFRIGRGLKALGVICQAGTANA